MGKTDKHTNNNKEPVHKTKKPASDVGTSKSIASALRSIELPKTAEGLTAEQLTADQKIVFKRECQHLYGYKATNKRKLPANSIESASFQLAEKMRQKAEQLKNRKQMKPPSASTSTSK